MHYAEPVRTPQSDFELESEGDRNLEEKQKVDRITKAPLLLRLPASGKSELN